MTAGGDMSSQRVSSEMSTELFNCGKTCASAATSQCIANAREEHDYIN
jgi:hypothetical protein